MNRRIALSHAAGLVGEALLEKFSESGMAPDSLVLLGDESQVGKRLGYAGTYLSIADQQQADLSEYALLLQLQADPQLEAAAVQQGCLVVSHAIDGDDAAIFLAADTAEPEVAYSATRLRLVGPETACLLPVLIGLDRLAGLASIHLTSLRGAEFYGKAGVDELAAQTVNLLNSRPVEASVYPQQIAFNLLPREVDDRMAGDIAGFMVDRSCAATVHCVDVPVFHGCAVAVQLAFAGNAEMADVERVLSGLDGVILKSGESSPISDCNQSFSCAISHLRQASGKPTNLQFWMIADPLRYGLANNYVNVVDFLLKSFL